MSHYPTLKSPPAVEAVLDARGVFPKGVELDAFAQLAGVFQESYPKRTEERLLQFGFQHQTGASPQAITQDQGVRGYRFHSADGKEVVRCSKDGFTFHRLKPYTEWEDVYPKAVAAWNVFCHAFPQIQIHKVSLRYINQIVVPLTNGKEDLDTYFLVNFPGPKDWELPRTGFMGQSVFSDPDTGFQANWIMAHQPNPNPDRLHVILDIDVFAIGPNATETPPPNLWEKMRDLKNKLFFSSLTEKCIHSFQQ
jgi:uncharacterized protein (TIGR04255 family)